MHLGPYFVRCKNCFLIVVSSYKTCILYHVVGPRRGYVLVFVDESLVCGSTKAFFRSTYVI